MFSQTVEYALRAMVYLASHAGEAANAETIAAATRVPPGYLSKVMRDLVVARLVSSQRGPRGGFTLTSDPRTVTVLAVVNAVDPIKRIDRCPLGNTEHIKLCPLHSRLDSALAAVETTLAGTTLADLLSGGGSPNGRCAGVAAVPGPLPLHPARQPLSAAGTPPPITRARPGRRPAPP